MQCKNNHHYAVAKPKLIESRVTSGPCDHHKSAADIKLPDFEGFHCTTSSECSKMAPTIYTTKRTTGNENVHFFFLETYFN